MLKLKGLMSLSAISSKTYSKIQSSPEVLRLLVEDTQKDVLVCIFEWFKHCKMKTHGRLPAVRNMAESTCVETLDKLIRLDQSNYDEIVLCLDIALSDKFWKANIQSLGTLRNKCSDGQTKFEHLLCRLIAREEKENDDNNTNSCAHLELL